MRFEFATTTRIVFGAGVLKEAGTLAAKMGRCALVVIGSTASRAQPLLDDLDKYDLKSVIFSVDHEPTVETVRQGVEFGRREKCEMVIGFGGGSVLDTAKAVSVLLTNPGDIFDYLEIIGSAMPFTERSAPTIAIPTTSGTGSEVTRNAVLASPEHKIKVSMRTSLMLPRLALVDPRLTYGVPPAVTASTGLDALTQVLEPYVSSQANPLIDAVCREAMIRAARSLRRTYENGEDAEARYDMALVSLFGGLALANAGLGVVHGFAGPIGGMFDAPHGVVCASILPHAIEMNVRALKERSPTSPYLRRYNEIGQFLTGDPDAGASHAVSWIQSLCQAMHVPPLSKYGMTDQDIPVLVEKAAKASSMKANPIHLTAEEMIEILRNAR